MSRERPTMGGKKGLPDSKCQSLRECWGDGLLPHGSYGCVYCVKIHMCLDLCVCVVHMYVCMYV